MNESIETQTADIYSFCQPAGLLHDTIPTPSKSSKVGLVVSLGLWDISLQERQERICVGRSGSGVAGVSGGGRRSGYWFGRVILGKFRCEVGGKGGSLRWGWGGELFYGTDMVTGSLRRGHE